MHILPIRQIIKPLQQLLFLAIGMQPLAVPTAVLGNTPYGINGLKDNEGTVSSQQALDGREVPRDFGGEEEVGAGDVSCAEDSGDS